MDQEEIEQEERKESPEPQNLESNVLSRDDSDTERMEQEAPPAEVNIAEDQVSDLATQEEPKDPGQIQSTTQSVEHEEQKETEEVSISYQEVHEAPEPDLLDEQEEKKAPEEDYVAQNLIEQDPKEDSNVEQQENKVPEQELAHQGEIEEQKEDLSVKQELKQAPEEESFAEQENQNDVQDELPANRQEQKWQEEGLPNEDKEQEEDTPALPSLGKRMSQDYMDDIERRIQERVQENMKKNAEKEAKRQAERKIEEDKHAAIQARTAEVISKNQETLRSTQATLDKVARTLDNVREAEAKWKAFEDKYNELFKGSLRRLSPMAEDIPVEELQAQFGSPIESDIADAAVYLSDRQNICILVGEEVAQEAGVIIDMEWQIDDQEMNNEQMHNLNIFECYPLEFWQKQLFVKSMTDQIPLSNTHTAMRDIYNGLSKIGRHVFVVTQNAEGLERKALENPDAEIYEIHGNLNQMRCCAGCTADLYPTPDAVDQLDFIPLCYTCGGLARPNILLNDECYDEELYKAETAFRATESADCLIILGSSLEQSLPATIVKAAAKRGALVIEIGETCQLEYGNALQVKEKTIEAFPMLVEVLGQVLFR